MSEHENFYQEVPQVPPFNDPEVRTAWRHGLAGSVAVNAYIKLVVSLGGENLKSYEPEEEV